MNNKVTESFEEIIKRLSRMETTMLTKDDLALALDKVTEDIGEVVKELINELDQKKAEKEDLNEVEKRVTRLEHKVVM